MTITETAAPTSVRRRMAFKHSLPRVLMLLAIMVATACAPLQPDGAAGDTRSQRAAILAKQQRHDDAAEAYLELAARTEGPERERYLIRAARQRHLAGRLGAAQAILDSLPVPVDKSNRLGWAQVAADLALARNQAAKALEILDQAPRSKKPEATAELLRIRAEALFRLGDPVGATRAYLEREIWLRDRAEITENQQLLWAGFQRWGQTLKPDAVTEADDPVLAGWLELGRIAASYRDSKSGMAIALKTWQQRYPSHPANDVLVARLLQDIGPIATMPTRVAVLLPLAGRQQASGTAIRDGMLAAHYASGGQTDQPVIDFYDVDTLGAANAIQIAAASGAQFIVGPLLKDSVRTIAQADLPVPVLALNYLPADAPPPPGLYQYALAPEDEAEQIAERAIAAGQSRAIVFAPDNAWGRRLQNSFVSTFTGLGGIVIASRFYEPCEPDFSYGIRSVLLIDESQARYERLKANLRMDIGFEPRRRQDVDLIFLAATHTDGKLIRPQLKFYYAGNIPTYATSAIYQEGSRNNSDLNGIIFPDMPWMIDPDLETQAIRTTLKQLWPGPASRFARLYAMGFDAYHLVPELAAGAMHPADEIAGVTGRLHLAGDGRIHRKLRWAQFRRGRPVRLEEASEPGVSTPASND